jgi:ubiquinone biosynthesis protein COQ9
MKRKDAKDKILLAVLPHVAFDGWTEKSLALGVEDAGLSPDMALRTFPEGMRELAAHFSDYTDRKMLTALKKRDLGSMKVREKIALSVRLRLEANAEHREAIRHLLSFLALPFNAGVALSNTYRTVDNIWYALGDESVDFNFYTKRALLASVYGATVLCWLGDSSENFQETWDFLDRRINDVLKIPKWKADIREALSNLPSFPFGAVKS